MKYEISFEKELAEVEYAITYYLDWAEEFRRTTFDWDFVTYYYRGLRDASKVSQIRFRALFFAMRIQPVLTFVREFVSTNGHPPLILDLGSGIGLESLLLSLAGASVHGVDGWLPMVEQAQARQSRYEERFELNLDLHYTYENIFKFNPGVTYDAVYSSATLHHIEPIDEAIQRITDLIEPGGLFFLSDENGYSPIQQLAVQKKIGWIKPRKYLRTDPDTGEKFLYGNENIRFPVRWRILIRQAGLEPRSIKYCRFIPPVDWPVEKLLQAERMIRNMPLIGPISAIGFMLISEKPSLTP
jgi:SAM-dependent methyltransferase